MDLIGLIFILIICPSAFAFSWLAEYTGHNIYALISILATLISFGIGISLLYLSIALALQRFNVKHIELSRWLTYKCKNKDIIIVCRKEGKYWYLMKLDKKIYFDLHFLVFKKAFMEAFVSRAIRYKTISGHLPCRKISKKRLKIVNKSLIAYLDFDNGNKIKRIKIADKGVSRMSLLAWLITTIVAPKPKFLRRITALDYGDDITKFNELMFVLMYFKLEKMHILYTKQDD